MSRTSSPARTRLKSDALAITEAQLLAAVRDFVLRACRGIFYHTWRSDHSSAGFPDVCAVIGDRLVFAELKRDGKRPTPAQQLWLDRLAACRTIEVYWWTGSDLDEARRALKP